MAPFWDDVDIRGGNGVISYEIHNSGYYLDHVSGFIQAIAFKGTWMLVAYWDAVHPYVGSDNTEVSNNSCLLLSLCQFSSLGEHLPSVCYHRWRIFLHCVYIHVWSHGMG